MRARDCMRRPSPMRGKRRGLEFSMSEGLPVFRGAGGIQPWYNLDCEAAIESVAPSPRMGEVGAGRWMLKEALGCSRV